MLSHGGERMFWRLTTVADDFGRFIAEITALVAMCFALMIREITDKQAEAWLAELVSAGLIRTYTVGGVRYGYFVNWSKYQQTRAQKSKFPEPPAADSACDHLQADVTEKNAPRSDSNTNSNTNADSNSDTNTNALPDDFLRFWKVYPRHDKRKVALKAWLKLSSADKAVAIADVPLRVAANWAGRARHHMPLPASYLNERQFEDELEVNQIVAPAARRLSPKRQELFEDIQRDVAKEAANESVASQKALTQGQHDLDEAADR